MRAWLACGDLHKPRDPRRGPILQAEAYRQRPLRLRVHPTSRLARGVVNLVPLAVDALDMHFLPHARCGGARRGLFCALVVWVALERRVSVLAQHLGRAAVNVRKSAVVPLLPTRPSAPLLHERGCHASSGGWYLWYLQCRNQGCRHHG